GGAFDPSTGSFRGGTQKHLCRMQRRKRSSIRRSSVLGYLAKVAYIVCVIPLRLTYWKLASRSPWCSVCWVTPVFRPLPITCTYGRNGWHRSKVHFNCWI